MKNIYLHLADEANYKDRLVIATVTRTRGSTPQKPGSSALFSGKGLITGTVGGGIVEGRVQKAATEAVTSMRSCHYTYNLYNDISKTEEAICGGQISVLIDANPGKSIQVFRQLKESVQKRIPGVLITMVNDTDESSVIISRYWMSGQVVHDLQEEFSEKIAPVAAEMIASGDSWCYREMSLSLPDEPALWFFLQPVFPPDNLVIAGAGHVGRALAHLGNILDFEVTVIDDRPEYANKENIPDADQIIVKDIGTAMQEIKKGEFTYVVIVTRGHKDDAEALKPCIGAPLAYAGMIGSRKKVATMRDSFIERGFATKEQWDRIYSPIGIDIGSQSVEEIAVSIGAQLIQVRNRKKQEVSNNQSAKL